LPGPWKDRAMRDEGDLEELLPKAVKFGTCPGG